MPARHWSELGSADRAQVLGSALLYGRTPAVSGVPIRGHYHVVAIANAPETKASTRKPPAAELPAEPQRRIRSRLTERYGDAAVVNLDSSGGTILLPSRGEPQLPGGLTAELAWVAEAPISAAAVHSSAAAIPRAVALARDLLDIVVRLGYAPDLYTLGDLTVEYQLTRTGPATGSLIAPVEALLETPDLIDTLQSHVAANFDRRKTATTLGVHRNTVDYRLRRIKDLTGLDPHNNSDLLRLQSALITYTYHRRSPVPNT
ncbi:helix-turn-helix domain-containing protein [Nocardia sp. 2]|uniref:Helix-turn-helix domain-containing protein n=1 Tax=Nocardia acididurans TaxID=2802282 RepID=A0ABS1MJH9_9NOCA|nr:helix-turn-helix domain-containing protein [Nocardia acididurans]MBL1080200.1 helix-turn-helix domain-containing protein [Nocardia acididurans]